MVGEGAEEAGNVDRVSDLFKFSRYYRLRMLAFLIQDQPLETLCGSLWNREIYRTHICGDPSDCTIIFVRPLSLPI